MGSTYRGAGGSLVGGMTVSTACVHLDESLSDLSYLTCRETTITATYREITPQAARREALGIPSSRPTVDTLGRTEATGFPSMIESSLLAIHVRSLFVLRIFHVHFYLDSAGPGAYYIDLYYILFLKIIFSVFHFIAISNSPLATVSAPE